MYARQNTCEHGVLAFFGDEMFHAPGFPLETVADPTGAGDTFAGGFFGYLAKHGRKTPKGGGSGNGSLKKPKSPSDQGKRSTSAPGTSRTPNLERIDEEEGEDRSQYESMREGGIGSLSHSNGQRVVDSEDDSEEEQTRRQLEQDVDEEMFDAH